MHLILIAFVILYSQCVFISQAQSVKCDPKDWFCIDGRNRKDLFSATVDVPQSGGVFEDAMISEPLVTTLVYNETTVPSGIAFNNNNTDVSTTLKTTIINTESPSQATEIPTTESSNEPQNLVSEGFPEPFPVQYQQIWNIETTLKNASAIDIVINEIDVDPATDYLYIRAGHENTTDETGQMLTGYLDKPQKYRIMQTKAFIRFVSTKARDQRYKGFSLTYMPYVKVPTTTEAPDETTPSDLDFDPESLTIILVLQEANKTKETWNLFKNLLAECVNQYVGVKQLGLEQANSSHILTSMQNCPDSWFNYESCIKFRFAVPLNMQELNHSASLEEMLSGHNDDDEYELNALHLREMWEDFGRNAFLSNGYHEYIIPDTDYMILIWSGIGLAITFVFLIVLYTIWKMDILRDYHLMTGRADDQKNILTNQSEIDITMFPSPHQIVPTLFPSNSDPIQRMYDESQPIRFSRSDFPPNRDERSTSQRSEHTRQDGFTPIPESMAETRLDMNQLYGEDEVAFERRPTASQTPGMKQRIHLRGMNQHESMS